MAGMPDPTSAAPRPRTTGHEAFLQGIEARAWVFALNQCGDAGLARQAMESGLREFLARAQGLPLAQWPLQFWASLLRQPVMLSKFDRADAFAPFTPGPRAALLLRLIAGLDFAHASQVLGVTAEAYEMALRNALDHREMDDARMQALREHLHAQIHQMPEAQRQVLAEWRANALREAAPRPLPIHLVRVPRAGGRRGLWIGLALLLAALAITFYWPLHAPEVAEGGEPLPVEEVAPVPALTDTVLATHPDYMQLAHPEDEPLAQRVAMLSWIASAMPAGSAMTSSVDEVPEASATASAFSALPAGSRSLLASAQSAWPMLDAPTRAALLAQASDWQSRTPGQRTELRQRVAAWDDQPATAKVARRSAFADWLQLPPHDRQRLRAAAAHLRNLPPADRNAIEIQFAALTADQQRLWQLGPSRGNELAPILPLFAFLPEAERPALLDTLGALDHDARANLALLVPRLDEAGRQALRRKLLATPAQERAALIQARLTQ